MKILISFLFIVSGLLLITFFRIYSGEANHYPFLFWMTGLILMIAGGFILYLHVKTTELTQEKVANTIINDLKLKGEKIIVDFSQCEIKGNNYTEEREITNNQSDLIIPSSEQDIQILNALGGGAMRNIEQVEVTQSVIVFSKQNSRSGLTEKFVSPVIYKDKITLSFHMEQQKETNLYVDKKDRSKYYFDLNFLNNKDNC